MIEILFINKLSERYVRSPVLAIDKPLLLDSDLFKIIQQI